jgi:hypothetical protein
LPTPTRPRCEETRARTATGSSPCAGRPRVSPSPSRYRPADPEAGVLVRKLSQQTPLSNAKQANPRYFIMLCGISCELAG